jgi:hypothetical protein
MKCRVSARLSKNSGAAMQEATLGEAGSCCPVPQRAEHLLSQPNGLDWVTTEQVRHSKLR